VVDPNSLICAWQNGRTERIDYPTGETVSYGYDEGGQVVSVTGLLPGQSPTTYVEDIGYDQYGQRTYIRYGNGVETEYHYDLVRRWLSSIQTEGSGEVHQDISYSFDAVGNVTAMTNNAGRYRTSQSYDYDDLYQLTVAQGHYESRPYTSLDYTGNYRQDFTYDQIGNITSKVSSSWTNASRPMGADLNYQLDYQYYEDKPHQVEIIGNRYYQYDANGNLVMEREGGHGNVDTGTGYLIEELSDRVSGTAYGWGLDRSGGTVESDVYQRTYLWNEENRLIQSQDNNITVQYRYNADGERSHKYSDRGENLYFDSLYSSASTGDIDRMRDSIHIYLGQTRIATRLKMDDSSDYEYSRLNTYYYHSDHLGSAQLVTDYAGEEYEHMEYTPYGELWLERNRDGSDLIPFRFTGKEFDTETNLYYYGARYMDPRTSRWISSDPAGAMLASPMGDGGKPRQNFSLIESINHYSYVSNNPVKYVDPTGMFVEDADELTKQQDSDHTIGTSDETINDVGCVLTSYTRIAIALSGREISLEDANQVAIDNNLYANGNLLSPEAGAELINLLVRDPTKTVVFAGSITGSDSDIASQINALESSALSYYLTARLDTTNADGSISYLHTVNINGGAVAASDITDMSNALKIQLNDSSTANRMWSQGDTRTNDIIRVDKFLVYDAIHDIR
jgi:RHS repeat-associated protein